MYTQTQSQIQPASCRKQGGHLKGKRWAQSTWEARVSVRRLVALKCGNFERTLSSYTTGMQWDGESCPGRFKQASNQSD